MEIFLYAIIFIIGCFFGSFFTLAVYRIPKKEDILIKHSYCPNCNHKLGFFDLFPILSYVLLGGKCRYCKNKIRPRYLILELLSGFTFLILAISMKVNIYDIKSIITVSFLLLYISVLFIIAGIDKENIKIEKGVLIFGFIVQVLYIIYQYALKEFNVYQYVMYFIVFVTILIISRIKNKHNYLLQNAYLSLYMIIYAGVKPYIFTIILSIILVLLTKRKTDKVAIGFYLCGSNIISIILLNMVSNFIV